MVRLRHRGAEAVDAGTFWNFETGNKVKLAQRGLLPGDPSQSYYKAPPLLILSVAAAVAHLLIYVLPKFLVQFYAAHTDMLVATYVVLDFLFIGALVIGIMVAGAGDILSGTVKWPSFRLPELAPSMVRTDDEDRGNN